MALSETRKAFNKAFRAARASGKKIFTFRGERYHTRLASDKKVATPTRRPARAADKKAVKKKAPAAKPKNPSPKGKGDARKASQAGLRQGKLVASKPRPTKKAAPAKKKYDKNKPRPVSKNRRSSKR